METIGIHRSTRKNFGGEPHNWTKRILGLSWGFALAPVSAVEDSFRAEQCD